MADDFLIILDEILQSLENKESSYEKIYDVKLLRCCLLEKGLRESQYNFDMDLKLG
jgi:hypothetical protein